LIILSNISWLSVLIPWITGVIFRKNHNSLQKAFWYFISFSTVFEGFAGYLALNGIPNQFLFRGFLIIDLLFFTWFFYKIFTYPKLLKVATILIIIFAIVGEFVIVFSKYNPKFVALFYILTFFYFVLQCRQALQNEFNKLDISPFSNYVFWIAAGRLIYYLFILFAFIYPSFISNVYINKLFGDSFTSINSIANIILNLMYAASLYQNGSKTNFHKILALRVNNHKFKK